MGWKEWAADGFNIYKVPGTHDDLMLEPNVQELVSKLERALEQVSPYQTDTLV